MSRCIFDGIRGGTWNGAELTSPSHSPQGIVIPVGKEQFQYAVHLIATLKHVHNTSLPIQVAYAGNDDLPPERRAALRSISPDVYAFSCARAGRN